jgi:hypothetical protein
MPRTRARRGGRKTKGLRKSRRSTSRTQTKKRRGGIRCFSLANNRYYYPAAFCYPGDVRD